MTVLIYEHVHYTDKTWHFVWIYSKFVSKQTCLSILIDENKDTVEKTICEFGEARYYVEIYSNDNNNLNGI